MNYTHYHVINRVGYITLDRPHKSNALNSEFVAELQTVFSFASTDHNSKVLVLRSSATVFCAGADLAHLKTLQQNNYTQNLADSEQLMKLYKQIYFSPKIVIAQVEGHAIAGGAGLATVCDFIFAVPEALFGYTEVKIGFVPAIVSVFLLKKIGETRTKELLLTGNLISAERAKQIGLINFVETKHDIAKATTNFAETIANETSAQSIASTKELIAHVQELSLEQAILYASQINAQARTTSDCIKGIEAFLNKEKIVW